MQESSEQRGGLAPRLDSMGRSGIVKATAIITFTTALLFVCAGRRDWPIAWAYTGVW